MKKDLTENLTPEMEEALDDLYNSYESAYLALSKANLLMQCASIKQKALYRRFGLATQFSNLTGELLVTDGGDIRIKMKKKAKKGKAVRE